MTPGARRVLGVIVVLGVGAVAWLGGQAWDAPWAIPWLSRRLSAATGWSVTMGRLQMTPWRGFRAEELFIQPAGGGRLHVRIVEARYRLDDLWRGRISSRWVARHIHLDPGSWRIKRSEVIARVSSGPVVEELTARVVASPHGVVVERFRGRGRELRFQGAGQRPTGGVLQYWVRGQVATALLKTFGIHQARGTWEPFLFQAGGTAARPAVHLRSRFLTLRVGSLGASS